MAGGLLSKPAKASLSSAAATPSPTSAAFPIPDRVVEHAARVRAFVALCPINRSTTSKDFPLNKRWLTTNQEKYDLKGAEHKVKYGFKTTFTEHGLASDAYERYLKEEDGGLPERIRAILTTNKVSQPGIDDPNFRWAKVSIRKMSSIRKTALARNATLQGCLERLASSNNTTPNNTLRRRS